MSDPTPYVIPAATALEAIADTKNTDLTAASVDHWSRWIGTYLEDCADKGVYSYDFLQGRASKADGVYPLDKVYDAVKAAFEAQGYTVTKVLETVGSGEDAYDDHRITVGFESA